MANDNLLIAVPTRGQIGWQTVTRLEEIRDSRPGLAPILYEPGNLSVAQTRNRIVKKFLATSCDFLMMVDDDIVPPPHVLETLMPRLGQFAMVAIPHPMPMPSDPGKLILSAFKLLPGTRELGVAELQPGINEVDAVATGCVAITREALVAVGPAPFRLDEDPDAVITSDDFLFCGELKAEGLKIGCWWDGWHCDHVRTVGLAPLFDNFMSK